jgi:hypothetical protein
MSLCQEVSVHFLAHRRVWSGREAVLSQRKSPLLRGVAERGCRVVSPAHVLVELVVRLAKTLTGKDIPRT